MIVGCRISFPSGYLCCFILGFTGMTQPMWGNFTAEFWGYKPNQPAIHGVLINKIGGTKTHI